MFRARIVATVFILSSLAATLGLTVQAYATYAKWGTPSVDFYINPSNADVSPEAAEAALLAGAGVWTNQSNAQFAFVYAGGANDTATAYDGRNVVFFRNTTNGYAIASTYSWSSNGLLVDSDIIFWDGGFTFFTGSWSCGGSNAAYIEDIAAHEFGHALGLHHSTVAGTTMYSGYSTCSMAQRTIEADDIAGVEALYPPVSAVVNTPPAVQISSPASGSSFTEGAAVSFSGSASDNEDGALGSSLVWSSSRDGYIGTGTSFQRVLSVGVHTITATVSDSQGSTAQALENVSVAAALAPVLEGFVATGRGYKVKGFQRADLTWNGASSSLVDVYRNGGRIGIAINTGNYTDPLNLKGGGAYTYMLCEAGTAVCSNPVKITF